MHKLGDARGAREVRHCSSSIHFHRAVPRSSSHAGPRERALRPGQVSHPRLLFHCLIEDTETHVLALSSYFKAQQNQP